MKQYLVLVVLLITMGLLSACDTHINDRETSHESLSVNTAEFDDTNEAKSDPVDSDADEITSVSWQKVELNLSGAQLLDTAPLYFTEVLGVRKRYESSLPVITGARYPYVFYERMSAITEGASQDDAAMYIGRYSAETQETQEFTIASFAGISDEARLVVDNDRIVYMYCMTDEQGELKMVIELFDYNSHTQKIIAEYPAYNVFGYAKKLNENELVFLLYEAVPEGSRQVILNYNIISDSLDEIYRGGIMTGYHTSPTSTKDVWAMDTSENNIILLMQQLRENIMTYSLNIMDGKGNVIQETELKAMSMYDAVDDTADSLNVKEDYVLIHFSQFNKDKDNTNSPFAMLHKGNEDYRLIEQDRDMTVTPKYLCGNGAPEVPYVCYSIYESKDKLIVFDVSTGKGLVLEASGEDIQNSVMDPSGNLLIVSRTDDKTTWRLLPSDFISENMKYKEVNNKTVDYTIKAEKESVSDGAHDREINILEISTESPNCAALQKNITDNFKAVLTDYLTTVPYEYQKLIIDSTYCEMDNVLCVCVLASTPSQYVSALNAKFAYWGLSDDKLYTLTEYLNIIGVDYDALTKSISPPIHTSYRDDSVFEIQGLFYINNDICFVIKIDSNPSGVRTSATAFYNYATKQLIVDTSFNGFDELIKNLI